MAGVSQVLENGHTRAGYICAADGMLLPGQVHKFGGTCVSAAERIASAAQLVLKGAEAGEQQVSFAIQSFFSAIAEVVFHSLPVLH